MFQEYKKHPLDLVSRFIPNDPVIFEAGGHYGEDTIRFTEKWPLSKVISFEPNPDAFKKLQDAVCKRSSQGVIQAYNLAVNNYNGTATLNVCYGTTGDNPLFEGASSLLEASPQMAIHYQGPKVEVPCVILDDWCKKNNIEQIDFMWLDLEGLELQVLKSSPSILTTVKAIYTETNMYDFRKGMTKYKELRSFLEASGFTMLSHWYFEGLQGNAIFIKKEYLHVSPDQQFKKS
ncbi:MAG: FkbM family methyltransferase [Candidatus Babeliales bacterium]